MSIAEGVDCRFVDRLEHVAEFVTAPKRVKLGVCCELHFGLKYGHRPLLKCFLKTPPCGISCFPRDDPRPRAIMNAADRLIGSDEAQLTDARQDLAVAVSQLCDYQSRFGMLILHEQ